MKRLLFILVFLASALALVSSAVAETHSVRRDKRALRNALRNIMAEQGIATFHSRMAKSMNGQASDLCVGGQDQYPPEPKSESPKNKPARPKLVMDEWLGTSEEIVLAAYQVNKERWDHYVAQCNMWYEGGAVKNTTPAERRLLAAKHCPTIRRRLPAIYGRDPACHYANYCREADHPKEYTAATKRVWARVQTYARRLVAAEHPDDIAAQIVAFGEELENEANAAEEARVKRVCSRAERSEQVEELCRGYGMGSGARKQVPVSASRGKLKPPQPRRKVMKPEPPKHQGLEPVEE